MYGCYVEVVFYFVAEAILFLCVFGFDIYPYILFHFFKMFFYYSCYTCMLVYKFAGIKCFGSTPPWETDVLHT